MTEKELKNWFMNKINSCYAVKHIDYPDSIFWFYDENKLRKIKLCNINNEINLNNNVSGVCLFEINLTNYTFYCDYSNIWSYLKMNYSDNYTDIQIFIKSLLNKNNNLNSLTIQGKWDIGSRMTNEWTIENLTSWLKNNNKLIIQTSFVSIRSNLNDLMLKIHIL